MARCKVCPFVGTLNLSTYQLLLSICCRRFEAYCFRMSNFRCRLILASGWCEMIQVDAVDALQAWCIAVFAVRGEAVVLLAFYDLECPVLLKKCACMCISIADSNFWSLFLFWTCFHSFYMRHLPWWPPPLCPLRGGGGRPSSSSSPLTYPLPV